MTLTLSRRAKRRPRPSLDFWARFAVLGKPRSWVEDLEDEHGTFHVATHACGWRGREWADPDEADLERAAHDDEHRWGIR